jgi:hypothetical protein
MILVRVIGTLVQARGINIVKLHCIPDFEVTLDNDSLLIL